MAQIEVKAQRGQHCESTMLMHLLAQQGVELSEPMVFGLGSGLSFLYWHSKNIDFPLLGGRIKPDLLTTNLASAANLDFEIGETRSERRALENLTSAIDAGKLVGLKLDSYFLDYAEQSFHFAAHYAVCSGYDDHVAFMIDTIPVDPAQTTTLDSLRQARSFRGPMASPNRSVTLAADPETEWIDTAVPTALCQAAAAYLNPPIRNIGAPGIRKASAMARGWLTTLPSPASQLGDIGYVIEHAGTGGGLFRKMWGEFLTEAADVTGLGYLNKVAMTFLQIAEQWTRVSELLTQAGAELAQGPLEQAADLMLCIADSEGQAMADTLDIVKGSVDSQAEGVAS